MKTKHFPLLLSAIVVIFISACKKEKNEPATVTVPVLTTTNVTLITSGSAQSGGTITSTGGGTIEAKGLVWSTNSEPTISDNKTNDGSGESSFINYLIKLIPNTTYYVRAYATNSSGTGYGNTVSFKTLMLTDFDGNVYHTVTIGTQVWMVENLKVTKDKYGLPIDNITDQKEWSNATSDAYCWYNNDEKNKDTYGALYNWHAVNSGFFCPPGWHIPTDEEWTTLTNYLGGESVAGNKLKEMGLAHWDKSTNATNESGFTALPGGYRDHKGNFNFVGTYGFWWTSTSKDLFFSWARQIYSFESRVFGVMQAKEIGLSVRCIKD